MNTKDSVQVRDFRYFTPLVVCAFSLFVQIVTLVLFLCGTTAFQGRTISVVVAVKFLIEIFSVNSATAYSRVVGLFAAVFYFLFLAFIIKNLCVTARDLPELIKSRSSLSSRRYNSSRLSRLMYECFLTFELVCLFSVFVGLWGGKTLPVQTAVIMVLTGVVFLGRGAAFHSLEFGTWSFQATLPDFLKDAIGFLCICVLVFVLQFAAIKEFHAAFLMFSSGNLITASTDVVMGIGILYLRFIFPACIFATLFLLLFFLHDYLPHCMRKKNITTEIRKLLVLAAVMTVLHLIMTSVLAGSFSFIVLANWFKGVRYTWFPMTIVCAVLLYLEINYRTNRHIS